MNRYAFTSIKPRAKSRTTIQPGIGDRVKFTKEYLDQTKNTDDDIYSKFHYLRGIIEKESDTKKDSWHVIWRNSRESMQESQEFKSSLTYE